MAHSGHPVSISFLPIHCCKTKLTLAEPCAFPHCSKVHSERHVCPSLVSPTRSKCLTSVLRVPNSLQPSLKHYLKIYVLKLVCNFFLFNGFSNREHQLEQLISLTLISSSSSSISGSFITLSYSHISSSLVFFL